jgi:hypothetical protein
MEEIILKNWNEGSVNAVCFFSHDSFPIMNVLYEFNGVPVSPYEASKAGRKIKLDPEFKIAPHVNTKQALTAYITDTLKINRNTPLYGEIYGKFSGQLEMGERIFEPKKLGY